MGKPEICITTELAKENGKLRIIYHENEGYYVADVKSDGQIKESRLLSINLSGADIRKSLELLAEYHQKIIEQAKQTIMMQMS